MNWHCECEFMIKPYSILLHEEIFTAAIFNTKRWLSKTDSNAERHCFNDLSFFFEIKNPHANAISES